MDIQSAFSVRCVDDASSERLSLENSATINVSEHSKKSEIFLKEQGAFIHPIFDSELTQARPGFSEPRRNAFSESTHQHTEQFLEAMKLYQASIKDEKASSLDLRGKHCWEDVLRAAKEAEATYLRSGDHLSRKLGRFITANVEVALPFLYLLPNDWYCCVLFGGLKLVFEGLSRISERTDRVLKTLLRIPDVIVQAEDCVGNFPSDEILYNRATDFFVAVLTALEGTTQWLMRKSVWKVISKPFPALLLGSRYDKPFKDKLLALDKALDAIQNRVSTLRDGAIVKIEKVVENVETVMNAVEKNGEATLQQVYTVQSDVNSLQQSANRADVRVSSMTEDIKQTHVKLDHLNDLQQAKDDAKRAMEIVLDETAKTAQWMEKHDRVIRRLKWHIQYLEQAATSLTPNDLLDILDVNANVPVQDLRRISRACQSTQASVFRIVTSVFQDEKYREWFTTDMSAGLFIEGSSFSASHGRNTPMSLLSCSVIDHLHDKGPAIAIHYFCGSHTSSQDALKGPHGMMRSLISQVLRWFTVDLDFVGTRRYRDQLEKLNLHILCDCFTKLVKRLPMDTVLVCVIDGISFFRGKDWAEDCQRMMDHLCDLADDDGQGAVFKLLVTSPSRGKHAADNFNFPDQWRLALPAEDLDGRKALTERDLAMKMSRPMNGAQQGSIPAPTRIVPDVGSAELWDLMSDSDASNSDLN